MSLRPKTWVGLAFGSEPLDLVPIWSDMSTRLYSAHTERGRESRLDEYLPGILTLGLKNNDGALLPDNPDSPYTIGGGGYPDAVLADTPLLYWRLGEADPTVTDASGNGNDGEVGSGSPVFEESGLLSDGNKAVSFADLSHSLDSFPNFFNVSQPEWAIEGWVQFDAAPFGATQLIFGLPSFQVEFRSTATQEIRGRYNDGASDHLTGGYAITPGVPYHVAFDADGTNIRLIINGTVVATAAQPADVSASGQYFFASGLNHDRLVLDELAMYDHSLYAGGGYAAHYAAGIAAGATAVIPGVQVLVADGFVGRTMMASPACYWPFDESTAPAHDIVRSAPLSPPASSRTPTFAVEGILGRGAEFDGISQALHTESTGLGAPSRSGRSLIAVVRVDSTGMIAQFNHLISTGSTLMQRALALDYTTDAKLRLRIRSTAAEKFVKVAASTGWHLIVAGYYNGLKPVLRVDGVVTSSTAVLSGETVRLSEALVGYGSSDSSDVAAQFAGVVDELAVTDRFLSNADADEFLEQYQSRWRPGVVHFRGHVQPEEPYDFAFPNKRDTMVTVKAIDWAARLSNVTVPLTGPSSSTSPPIRIGANENSGARVIRILNASKVPVGMRRVDVGYSLMLGTSWGVNALGEAQQVTKSENGAFYALRHGTLRYENRYRPFQDARQISPQSTYSDEDPSTSLGYREPRQGYAQLVRNSIVISNTTFSTSLESTSSQDRYGIGTTERTDMRNAYAADMVEQARFVLRAYSTGRFTPTEFSVTPLESSSAYRAMCFRELRDRIRTKMLAAGAPARVEVESTIEKETKTIGRGQMLVTYGLDSADRFSFLTSTQLLTLDSTTASKRLNSGRLGF